MAFHDLCHTAAPPLCPRHGFDYATCPACVEDIERLLREGFAQVDALVYDTEQGRYL